jgi:pyruvate dehydrogenase E2 component (dihydrolipoamide acetyltransferase)
MEGTPLTGWRKIANALWRAPDDPQIYSAFELDATPTSGLFQRARQQGQHITATHVVGRAVAQALVAVPDLNVRLVRDRAVPREGIDVFFITSVAKGRDLTGIKIADADRKSVVDVAKELRVRSQRAKTGTDPDFARIKHTMEALPRPILRLALQIAARVSGDRGWSLPSIGLAGSPFGSAMVSSVGMFGLPMGFAPLVWMYRVPLLVLVGEITPKPVAIGSSVLVRPVLPITATIDHRYVDGAHLAKALTAFRGYLAAPAAFEPAFTRGGRPRLRNVSREV